MIKIIVDMRGDEIVKVTAKGHAGYAKYGKDIVCSAASAIMQTALMGLIDVYGESQKYEKNDENGYLRFSVPEEKTETERMKEQAVLRAMYLGLKDLEAGFKANLKMEVNTLCL